MKKILILFLFIVAGLSATAEPIETAQTMQIGIEFDWISKTQLQRDENIEEIKSILFSENAQNFAKKEFKEKYADFLKDDNSREHYIKVSDGVTEDANAKYSGFFLKGKKALYMYAIQFKKSPKNVYYYDALGGLRYVDIISDNYPNYPYYSTQYYVDGKIVSKIYFNSLVDQYMYNPDGSFKGRWYKDSMYNKNADVIMTRSNY